MRQRHGFTLVELVLVISLTMILASAALGGLRNMTRWRMSAAVGRVQSDLLYARDLAMLSARRTWCEFDLRGQAYELGQEPAPASGAIASKPIAHPLTGDTWRVTLAELADGLTVASDDPEFGFAADGVPVDASGRWLGSSGAEVRFSNGATLTVAGGTGLPEVQW